MDGKLVNSNKRAPLLFFSYCRLRTLLMQQILKKMKATQIKETKMGMVMILDLMKMTTALRAKTRAKRRQERRGRCAHPSRAGGWCPSSSKPSNRGQTCLTKSVVSCYLHT